MTALTGWIARSPLGGMVNPYLSPALRQYIVDFWPAYAAAATPAKLGALVTHWPVSAAPRALAGWRARGFVDDWYYRVHVRPSPLVLGHVLETQITTVKVWNAWFAPQTLVSISGLEEGIALAGPSGPPTPFSALQEQDWQVSVTREGPGRIDVTLTWLFAAVPAPRLRITGNRVVAWPFVPNWADGILERLAWQTEVMTSGSGAEQRRALRLSPRRVFEAKLLVEGRDRALLDLSLAAWGGRIWALPIWPDVQLLPAAVALGAVTVPCDTVQRDFRAGGLAMMIGADAFDAEAAEILSVASNALTLKRPTQRAWPAGGRLYPARTAALQQQPALRRKNDRLSEVEVAFGISEPSDWPAVAPATLYRGAPVLAERPSETEDLTSTWQRLLLELDNGSGLPALTDTADLGFAIQGHRWLLAGRPAQAAWRSLMYALRGRQVPLWLPTHAEDLTLVAEAAPSAGAIDVQAVGYTRFAVGRPGRRDLRIELSDGTALHRRVTGAAELAGDIERLSIDAAPGVTLRPATAGATAVHCTRISYLQLARLDQDEIELHHVTDADGVATTAQLMLRTLRDELELA